MARKQKPQKYQKTKKPRQKEEVIHAFQAQDLRKKTVYDMLDGGRKVFRIGTPVM